jgi:tRNA(Arg) A34 adenosine deaminase TadA
MNEEADWTQEQDARFMELALRHAATAVSSGQTPFGAVLVGRDGQLIGEGHNTVRADLDPTAHAEIVAIRQAWRRLGRWRMLAGSSLYSSCEPCLLCSFAITQIGVSRVVFAAYGRDVPTYKPLLDAELAEVAAWVNAQRDWAPLEVVGGFMRERALEMISLFPWLEAQTRDVLDTSR